MCHCHTCWAETHSAWPIINPCYEFVCSKFTTYSFACSRRSSCFAHSMIQCNIYLFFSVTILTMCIFIFLPVYMVTWFTGLFSLRIFSLATPYAHKHNSVSHFPTFIAHLFPQEPVRTCVCMCVISSSQKEFPL